MMGRAMPAGQPTAPMTSAIASLRTNPANLNHHLFRNNGCHWWMHYTMHLPNNTAERVRRSLNTADLALARARRDEFLAALPQRVSPVA